MSARAAELRSDLSAALAEARLRLINVSRYPGQLLLDLLLPVLFAALPIFLSQALPGGGAVETFRGNTGTDNVAAYLLVGSTAYILVTRAFWDMAYWMRFEQQVGTLEAIYMTPTDSLVLLGGVALYSAARGLVTGVAAYLLGCLAFQVNPIQGDVLLAWLFILSGLVPLYALALMFGAVVLRVKESNSLVTLLQWGISFLMGVYYPVKMLPSMVQGVALLFPPTWLVNGARSSLLGVGFFLSEWYFDLAILWSFLLVTPLLSVWLFRRTERGVRGRYGLGHY